MAKKPSAAPGERLLNGILLALTISALCNLLMTASIVGLVGTVLILIMTWGIHRGDYPLAKALAIFLFLYGAFNFIVLAFVMFSGSKVRASSLVWWILYSLILIVLGCLLRGKTVREYLKTAKPPAEKKKKIHFFHGGWRDL